MCNKRENNGGRLLMVHISTAAWGHMHASTCWWRNILLHKSQPAEKGLGALATPDSRLVKTDTYWLVWATEEFRAERKNAYELNTAAVFLLCCTLVLSKLQPCWPFPGSSKQLSRRNRKVQWKEYIIPHWVFNMRRVVLQWDSNSQNSGNEKRKK